MRTYPRKDIQNRYPTLSHYIPMYPCRYPQKISNFLSQRVILLYPNIFFYIQNIYPNRCPIVYPMKIPHRYPSISWKISIFDIHNDIRLYILIIIPFYPIVSEIYISLDIRIHIQVWYLIISVIIHVYPKQDIPKVYP